MITSNYPNKTIGDLEPAKIYQLEKLDGTISEKFAQHDAIACMFNPYEYTVSKSNTYSESSNASGNTPQMEFKKSGPQTLKLSLTFDTYETGEDVSYTTRKLWKLMEPGNEKKQSQDKKTKQPTPFVAFAWGNFYFISVIQSMTQKFTLFDHTGKPLRAKVDITFIQYEDKEDYQNPTSGGTPIDRVWQISEGDRLDLIADAVYGDSSHWPKIAAYNQVVNPFCLFPGQELQIPLEQDL